MCRGKSIEPIANDFHSSTHQPHWTNSSAHERHPTQTFRHTPSHRSHSFSHHSPSAAFSDQLRASPHRSWNDLDRVSTVWYNTSYAEDAHTFPPSRPYPSSCQTLHKSVLPPSSAPGRHLHDSSPQAWKFGLLSPRNNQSGSNMPRSLPLWSLAAVVRTTTKGGLALFWLVWQVLLVFWGQDVSPLR